MPPSNMSQIGSKPFLSCDWGTTSFRLRLVQGAVTREKRTTDGCRKLNDRAGLGQSSQLARATAYSDYLREVLVAWDDLVAELKAPLPLVISGMASSSIGWQELPYARLPLKLNASNLNFAVVAWPEKPSWLGDIYLISGVRGEDDMMRGEETEAIGLMNGGDAEFLTRAPSFLILPGTHSKHLLIEDQAITSISTWMTGEMFELLAQFSILKNTIDLASLRESSASHWDAFSEGARLGGLRGLGLSIFRARTRTVLGGAAHGENAWFLSGVLIGAEISHLLEQSLAASRPVFLGGPPELRSLYAHASGLLNQGRSWTKFPSEHMEMAVPRAHALFLAQRDL
jgi:2-dehydro-3-deoxygalactonokinase